MRQNISPYYSCNTHAHCCKTLTAVDLMITVLWAVVPCSLIDR